MRRTASEVLRSLEMRVARLERQARSKSPLEEKLRNVLPNGISARVARNAKGTLQVTLSWNTNNVYDEFGMTEDEMSYIGDNHLSTNELRIYLKKAKDTIKENVRDADIKQDRSSDMSRGKIIYNLL